MRTIAVDELAEALEHPDIVLLDVRRAADFASDALVIPGAMRRDPQAIERWVESVPKERPVVIYCARGGSVSNSVLDRLLQEGIQARYLEGGIEGWRQSGREVTA